MIKQVFAEDSVSINPQYGLPIVTLDNLITFMVRSLFVVAGLLAFLYLILGGIKWITSGGDKAEVEKARNQIQAAIIGLIVVFASLALIALMERVLNIGLGVTGPINFPTLIK